MSGANPARGEAELAVGGARLVLRPSYEALVAAEGELGSLFGLMERAAEGRLALAEVAALFWHLARDRPAGLTRRTWGGPSWTAGWRVRRRCCGPSSGKF